MPRPALVIAVSAGAVAFAAIAAMALPAASAGAPALASAAGAPALASAAGAPALASAAGAPALASAAGAPALASTAGAPDPASCAGDFHLLWNSVNDGHAYFDTARGAWQRARGRWLPKAAAAATPEQCARVLAEALAELRDDHSSLSGKAPVATRRIPEDTDVWARFEGATAMVKSVRTGSEADLAGLHPGQAIQSIQGVAVGRVVRERLGTDGESAPARDWALRQVLAGPRQGSFHVGIRYQGAAKLVEVVRTGAGNGEAVPLIARKVGEARDLGFLRLKNTLGDPGIVMHFDAALQHLRDTRALILDLRETQSGGSEDVVRAILGRFVERESPWQVREPPRAKGKLAGKARTPLGDESAAKAKERGPESHESAAKARERGPVSHESSAKAGERGPVSHESSAKARERGPGGHEGSVKARERGPGGDESASARKSPWSPGIVRVTDLVAPRGPFTYRAPILVLVDRWTAAEGEALAAGLQSAAQATLVGTEMAGLRGRLREVRLPHTGLALRFPGERTLHVDGTPREALRPAVAVDLAKPSGGPGDPILYQALKLLEARK